MDVDMEKEVGDVSKTRRPRPKIMGRSASEK